MVRNFNKKLLDNKSLLVSIKMEEDRLDLFHFSFHFYFLFDLFSIFLFLEQLGLGLIDHAITLVT